MDPRDAGLVAGPSGLKRAGDASSWCAKRTRYDQQQVVPSLESSGSKSNSGCVSPVGGGECDETTNSSVDFCPGGTWLGDPEDVRVPKPGTPVDRKVLKRVGGKYLLGPKIGNGPVESITQYLARREGTDQFFHLKMLVLDASSPAEGGQSHKTAEGEKQAKLLLHSEYQLLKMLENEEGVIRAYDLFMVRESGFNWWLSFTTFVFVLFFPAGLCVRGGASAGERVRVRVHGTREEAHRAGRGLSGAARL